MKKKLLCLMLTVAMLTTILSACGGNPDNGGNTDDPKPDPAPEIVTEYEDKTASPDYAAITDFSAYTTYYFDASLGSDSNDGLTEETAKKTLKAATKLASKATVDVPTRILFKAGETFSGELTLDGFEAADETPLIVGNYGKTDEKPYAKIADGTKLITVRGGNVRVSGFELTNPNPSGDAPIAIYVLTNKSGANKNIVISDNYIHDFNFDWDSYLGWLEEEEQADYAAYRGKMPEDMTDEESICLRPEKVDEVFAYKTGGIIFGSGTSTFVGESWIENAWVENNVIERVSKSGMFLDAGWARRPGHNWGNNHYYDDENGYYPNRNVYVRGNTLSYTGGDGIILSSTVGGYIENNACYHANFLGRAGFANAGIWPHSCENIVMQYNEAAWTHLDNGAGDGQGFDIDIGNSSILFRYNYSHHNAGGGLLLCSCGTVETQYEKNGDVALDENNFPITKFTIPYWGKVVICNNMIVDNDTMIYLAGQVYDMEIYNNVFVTSAKRKNYKVISSRDMASGGVPAEKWIFSNNIFAARTEQEFVIETSFAKYSEFSNNAFFNFKGADVNNAEFVDNPSGNFVLDPGFMNVSAENGYENSKLFAPGNAGLIGSGKKTAKANKYDYSGNAVENVLYVGAIGAVNQ